MRIACDADANALANPAARLLRDRSQPKRAGRAQVDSILRKIDPECLGESAGASAQPLRL
jgi:hypothetical protein